MLEYGPKGLLALTARDQCQIRLTEIDFISARTVKAKPQASYQRCLRQRNEEEELSHQKGLMTDMTAKPESDSGPWVHSKASSQRPAYTRNWVTYASLFKNEAERSLRKSLKRGCLVPIGILWLSCISAVLCSWCFSTAISPEFSHPSKSLKTDEGTRKKSGCNYVSKTLKKQKFQEIPCPAWEQPQALAPGAELEEEAIRESESCALHHSQIHRCIFAAFVCAYNTAKGEAEENWETVFPGTVQTVNKPISFC